MATLRKGVKESYIDGNIKRTSDLGHYAGAPQSMGASHGNVRWETDFGLNHMPRLCRRANN